MNLISANISDLENVLKNGIYRREFFSGISDYSVSLALVGNMPDQKKNRD